MKYTNQEIFDIVAVHLLTQGRVSIWGERCRYRGPEGLKCAAGILIPDDLYEPKWDEEGTIWSEVVEEQPKLLGVGDRDFIEELQHIHDSVKPDRWLSVLKTFATDHELEHIILHNFMVGDVNIGG